MIVIPPQYTSLEYIRPITWDEVFDTWRQGEAHQESWRRHWQERGFDSWETWRKSYSAPLDPDHRQWHLYRMTDLLHDIPQLYGVPSRSWIEKCYGGERTKMLRDIIDHPIVAENDKVDSIMQNFPAETMLTGIVHDSKIVLVEGMHRATALARMVQDALPLSKTELTFALCDHPENIPAVGGGNK